MSSFSEMCSTETFLYLALLIKRLRVWDFVASWNGHHSVHLARHLYIYQVIPRAFRNNEISKGERCERERTNSQKQRHASYTFFRIRSCVMRMKLLRRNASSTIISYAIYTFITYVIMNAQVSRRKGKQALYTIHCLRNRVSGSRRQGEYGC